MSKQNVPFLDIPRQPPKLTPVKTRILFLSPTVEYGIEREPTRNDFNIIEDKSLGKGGFGCVWKVCHKQTKKIYAIKLINKNSIIKLNLCSQMNREIQIMYQLSHPHIITLYNHFEDDNGFYLLMQYASKGSLFNQLKRTNGLDQKKVAQYMREIISAVKFLHNSNPPIIHRDIKPENILLDSDGRCKLADFGWSNFHESDKQRETYCGTPDYLAPEMISKSGHNESVDIWSLGVLIFELLTGKTPFNFKGDRNVLFNSIKNLKIAWTNDFPPLAKDLVTKILRLNPKERLSLDEILEHQWFKQIPLIRPVLEPYKYTDKEKFYSHLIYSEKIGLKDKNTQSKSKSNNSDTQINEQKVLVKEDKAQIKANEIKKEIEKLKEENRKKDMEIEQLKRQLSNDKNLNSKLEEMKEKEKETLLTENAEKSQSLLQAQSDLEMMKIDYDHFKKEVQKLKSQKDEVSNKNIELINKASDLENKLKENEKSQKTEIDFLEWQLRKREEECNNPNLNNTKVTDYELMLSLTAINLKEQMKFLHEKFKLLRNIIIDNEKEECDYTNRLATSFDEKIEKLILSFKELKEQIENKEGLIITKEINENHKKNEELKKRLIWHKEQLKEFNKYKSQYGQTSIVMEEKNLEINMLKSSNKSNEEKSRYLNDLIASQEEKIKSLTETKEIYKTALYETEKIFSQYVKDKKLFDLIHFDSNFKDPC